MTVITCQHHPEDLGWMRSGYWGCKRCGWVAPIGAVKSAWYIRHPNLTSIIIGAIAAAVGFIALVIVSKWIG